MRCPLETREIRAMDSFRLTRDDCVGLAKSAVDAHTLGLAALRVLLDECGVRAVLADPSVCEAFSLPEAPACTDAIELWIRSHRVTVLGLSYRLDPTDAVDFVHQVLRFLIQRRLFRAMGGPIHGVVFAGLPEACVRVKRLAPEVLAVFRGGEDPEETLRGFGIETTRLPRALAETLAYDRDRIAFGQRLIADGAYHTLGPVDRSGYPGFGTASDSVVERLRHGVRRGLPPLIRAHAGPYLPDRADAVRLFLDWARRLAEAGLLDVLSIGTSQLTQSRFGEDWTGLANGGGVPLNSPEEFADVWRVSRPMLVRTYAGTRHMRQLADMYERTIHMAWHTLSFWWFCELDGRGPYSVRENLRHHFDVLDYVASVGKPFEPNVPHHFAFRGADDVSCIAAGFLAAKAARRAGIRHLILQIMLNTPRFTSGYHDLAKARALLRLVRELEDDSFRVIVQPRGGLDYFSPDENTAKAQLAAVTALMDDIEPRDAASPPIIHVVGYSEGCRLADPEVINESIRITRQALTEYRRLRAKGEIDDMTDHPGVAARTEELVSEVRVIVRALEQHLPDLYSPRGFYEVLSRGAFPLPELCACRAEFARATQWRTRPWRGGVCVTDTSGRPVSAAQRVEILATQGPPDREPSP